MQRTTGSMRDVLALIALVGVFASCKGGGGEAAAVKTDTNGVADNAPRSTLQGVAALLSDNNVLALLDTSLITTMRMDTLAVGKATDARVKSYASDQFSQNGQARQGVRGLVDRLRITLALPDKRPLRDMNKALSELQQKSGADFDKTYMNASIDVHNDIIKNIDEALGGKVAPDVKTFLQQLRSNQQAALNSAKQIQGGLR